MERLTMWHDGNHAICENEECSSGECPFADPVCERVQDVIDRLADIEDILGDEYDLDRLRELAQADREGRSLGRDAILAAAKAAGLPCSQQEVRRILSALDQAGLARVSRGRGGTRLTPAGRALCRRLETQEKL